MPHESPEFDRPTNDDASRESFEQRIHALLDERRAPEGDAWVQSQSELSQENQQLLLGQQLMLDGLEMSEIPELPHNFAQRCVATAFDEADPRPLAGQTISAKSSTWRFTAYAATICVLLAFIAAEPFWTWLRGSPLSGPMVENPPSEREPDVASPSAPEVPELAVEDIPKPDVDSPLGDEPEELGENPSSEMIALEDLFRDLRERIPPNDGEEKLYALLDDVRTGFRPVTDSVGGALNALRRSLPPTPKAESSDKPQAWLDRANSSRVS